MVVDKHYWTELLEDMLIAREALAHYEKFGLADTEPYAEYRKRRRTEER